MTESGSYCLFDTSIGRCGISWSEKGLLAVQLPERDVAATERRLRDRAGRQRSCPTGEMADCVAALQGYFDRGAADFRAVPLDWSRVSDFHAAIYRHLREIPYGTVLTYGELADRAGAAGAAQAIGTAMSRNPWPIVVPCHRVVAASGKLGGFSAHHGIALKRKLLAMEGASRETDAPTLPGLFAEAKAK